MRAFFDRYDYLACPVTQVEPFPVEQEYAAEIDGVPMGSYIEWMRSNSRISVTCCPADLGAGRLQRGRACPSACSSSRGRSASARCSRSRTRSSCAAASPTACRQLAS